MANTLKYGETTEKIIGCAMKMHREIDNGYNEVVHAGSLAIESGSAGINHKKQFELPIYYDDIIVAKKRVDFLAEEKIAVKIKAMASLINQTLAQALSCLACHKLEIGLLINPGASCPPFKRLINGQKQMSPKNPGNPFSQQKNQPSNPTNPRS